MTININDKVTVHLTDLGKRIVEDEKQKLFRGRPCTLYECDGADNLTIQLWELMRLFGSHMGNGMPIPFDTTITLSHDVVA